MDDWQQRVKEVADEIARYLEQHPAAADSLEGIASWWISKRRIDAELTLVFAALSQLAASGVLESDDKDGSDPIYRLKDKCH